MTEKDLYFTSQGGQVVIIRDYQQVLASPIAGRREAVFENMLILDLHRPVEQLATNRNQATFVTVSPRGCCTDWRISPFPGSPLMK
jgi:hypothetical protein